MQKTATPHWHKSILFLTTIVVVGIALAVGSVFIIYTAEVTHERTQQQVTRELSDLLAAVEDTVSIACFIKDKTLAAEVARGLIKNSIVHSVTITANGELLAHSEGEAHQVHGATTIPPEARDHLTRAVYASWRIKNEQVGQIELFPNTDEIELVVRRDFLFSATLLVLQLVMVVIAIVIVVLHWIVNPIKAMSDNLHHMDTAAGDRLQLPRGHVHTEVGRLADDINDMSEQLVAALQDERQLRLRLEMDERKYRSIFDNAGTGIFIADREGGIESANLAFVNLCDLPQTTSSATCHIADIAWLHPISPLEMIAQALDNNYTCASDLSITTESGAIRWLNLVVNSIGEGRVQGLASDVTERKKAEDVSEMRAITDPLTGTANRPGFEKILQSEITHRGTAQGDGFAMMHIDLDGFRRINEALGLPVGDEVLKMVGERLRNHLKSTDTIARFGGDEFALILSGITHAESAENVGDRLIRILAQNYHVAATPIKLSASIGIALYPTDGDSLPVLLRNTELALDHARSHGGSRYSFFDQGMAEAALQRRIMETDMQLALERNEFCLFLQPIVDITTNRVVGAEALIRWRHPSKGLIPPDVFIPLAEETGVIVDIGRWCLEAACSQLARWKEEGRDYYLSFNISGCQIPDGMPPDVLLEAIQHHGIEPSRLVVELTEGIFLSDVHCAQQWLRAVREQGLRVYLDDFGTGYSSLSYLKRFPVDTIKIDKSFVRDMGSETDDCTLVETMIVMARTLGMQIVAEGVETADQFVLLRNMGCRYTQGFYFSRPVPTEDFIAATERIDALLTTK